MGYEHCCLLSNRFRVFVISRIFINDGIALAGWVKSLNRSKNPKVRLAVLVYQSRNLDAGLEDATGLVRPDITGISVSLSDGKK